MAVRSSRGPRLMAVVAVIENGDGSRMMLGSKSVHAMSLEMQTDFGEYLHSPHPSKSYIPASQSATLNVEMSDVTFTYAEPYTGPLQLTQSGLYLPSMAFRALPAPTKESE